MSLNALFNGPGIGRRIDAERFDFVFQVEGDDPLALRHPGNERQEIALSGGGARALEGFRSDGSELGKVLALAQKLGAHRIVTDPAELARAVAAFTDGHGADAVLLCAATKSDDPIRVAAGSRD